MKHPTNVTLHCLCPEFYWDDFNSKYKFHLHSYSLTKILYAYAPGLEGPLCSKCSLSLWYILPNQEPGRELKTLKEMNQC